MQIYRVLKITLTGLLQYERTFDTKTIFFRKALSKATKLFVPTDKVPIIRLDFPSKACIFTNARHRLLR